VGFFWEGLPPYILSWSASHLSSPIVAIETGTFRGDTTQILAETFHECITIERSPHFAQSARTRFIGDPRITILEGSSRDKLTEAIPEKDLSSFFWLDAHGIYDFEDPTAEENPLLAELQMIISGRNSSNTIIAIDDARGMGTQPGWPAMSSIVVPLANAGFTTVYIDDVFLAVPDQLSPKLWELYQQSRTVEVSAVFHVWPHVTRAARRQITLNRIVERLPW
jgi:hypothetical protein